MDSFDQTFKKAKDFFDTAYHKTGEALSLQKLKIKLSSAENSLNKTYAALGKIWYESLTDEENLSQEVKTLLEEVNTKNNQISELKNEISNISGSAVCEKCGANSPKNAQYCIKCGEKIL